MRPPSFYDHSQNIPTEKKDMLNLNIDPSFEEELAAYSYMASVLGEWIAAEGIQNQLSAIDVLLWWSQQDRAEA